MKESLSSEHGSELLTHSLPDFLDGGGVANEGGGHLETLGGDVTNGSLHVVGDPLYEVRRVLVDNVQHLLIDFLGGHSTSEQASASEVSSVSRIRSAHHVLGIELLLSELRDSESSVLLGSSGSEGSETDHEEVESGEGHHVHSQLSEIAVELTGESERTGGSADGSRHQVVEVTVSGGGELQGSEADIVQGFVIEGEALVGVLHELVHRKSGVVGLDDSVGHLGGGDDGVSRHHSVGVLLSDLGDEQGTHTGTGTTTHRVGKLETLEAVARLGFLSHYVQHRVDELSSLGVVALGPVVAGSGLSEHEVVGSEQLTEGSSSHRVHGTGLEIHENGSGHVSAASGFVEVNVDSLELKVGVAVVGTGGVHAVLVGDHLPELGTDLVTALSSLNVNNFSHVSNLIEL
jgi:hypothetical protein